VADYETGLDETGLDETGLDETGLDETGLDETGLDAAYLGCDDCHKRCIRCSCCRARCSYFFDSSA